MIRSVTSAVISSLDLNIVITDRNVLDYLAQFPDEESQAEKALEALKVGVIAIQSASPTLDTQVVQAKFQEVESRMKGQLADFQKKVTDDLVRYFADRNGIVPRSIEGVFGDAGTLSRTFQNFFDPAEGKIARLMQAQIGPHSEFGRALDPQNKQGVIALIEARVQELVEKRLDDVLRQFSLDEDGSAMSRLNTMLADSFGRINESLGIKAATAAEAARGHVKGIEFERDLYEVFASLGNRVGDETEFVRGTVGSMSRCKKGDFVGTLGDTSGAPGANIVLEVKDQPLRLRDAIEELKDAKDNRDATCGIFVFALGTEPAEVGDFRKIGEDFFVTVDKDSLEGGQPLLYLEAAYKIARAMAVAAARKDEAGELDTQLILDQVNALDAWSDRIADIATKARTIQNCGKQIEAYATQFAADLDERVTAIVQALRRTQPTETAPRLR